MSEKNGQLFILVEEKCQKCKGDGAVANPLCAAKDYAKREGIPFTLPRGTKKTIECPMCKGNKTSQRRMSLAEVFSQEKWRQEVIADVESSLAELKKVQEKLLNRGNELHREMMVQARESIGTLLNHFNANLERSLKAGKDRLRAQKMVGGT
jgi:hypothetical protein